MNLCVIPARGGSKRIPRKNIKEFCGRPIITWSIEAALASNCFEHVIVSTDDEGIADVARNCGAKVPFIRPAELSDDFTGTIPVISHAIRWFQSQGENPDAVCCIYPTAPFLRIADIEQGLDSLASSGADYVFSVTSYPSPIQRALRIKPDNRVEMFNPECFDMRSQDLEKAYHDAAQFYWGTAEAWLAEKPIFSSDSIPAVLPRHRVQDIDTPEDWLYAELICKALQCDNK